MILDEPYNTWLVKHVVENLDDKMRFVLKVSAVTANGEVPITISLDLVWFILIQVEDDPKTKLDVALQLLKKPEFLANFKATINNRDAKRMLAEFLIFNYAVLDGLKAYIDFSVLNEPIDFVSHTLFIKRSNQPDTKEIAIERIRTITTVMDTGFKLIGDYPLQSVGMAIHKVILMEDIPERFKITKRLLDLGFKLFSDSPINNAEVAVMLINNRLNEPICAEIIKNHIPQFKELTIKVAGSAGNNLADYYYWVKEDLEAVKFLRDILGIDFTK